MARRSLEVISFPEPYTDLDKAAMIIAYTRALVHNEIPAFQVDVGDDRFLAGTLAVQRAIELGVEESCGKSAADGYDVPFKFSYQNLRAPFYVRPQHARSTTMPPHVDGKQIGPAIHKEYVGQPTKVQFGYVTDRTKLPPIKDDYTGPDLAEFSDTVYEGVTHLGRLSIFSQGNDYWGMAPTAHYFQRQANQRVGGRYTRYSMLDPAHCAFPDTSQYEQFVEMRTKASLHLDWRQWQLLGEDLRDYSDQISPAIHASYTDLIAQHTKGHPGEDYHYWAIDDQTYGVIPRTEDKQIFFINT